jgi:hypothetical protein
MSVNRQIFCVVIALALQSTACKKKEMPSADSAAPSAENFGAPPTEEECRQYAGRLITALQARNAAQFDKEIHLDNLVERAIQDLQLSEQDRRGFVAEAQKSLGQGGLGSTMLMAVGNGGSFKLLRVHSVDGRWRGLIRMISAEGAVNYYDFIPARFADGSIGMDDVYIFAAGEMFSQTLRRLVIPALAASGKPRILRSEENEYIKNASVITDMAKSLKQGNPRRTVDLFKKLPETLRNNKALLLVYLAACMRLEEADDHEYIAAMEKLRLLFPNDPCVDLISLDYYFLKHRHEDAVKATDLVIAAVGGDAYLTTLSAFFLVELKRFAEVRKRSEAAIKAEPDLELAYRVRLMAPLRENKHAETLEWLKKLTQNVKGVEDNLGQNADYAAFMKSPQYAEWQTWYRKHKKVK